MADPKYIEVARYRVILGDCDPMRIMYNGTYFRLFEIGWTELFRAVGEPLNGYIERDRYLAVLDANCRYLKPARYDDVVVIRTALLNVRSARFEVRYELVRDADGEVLARGRTMHAILGDNGRPHRIPAELRAAAQRFVAE